MEQFSLFANADEIQYEKESDEQLSTAALAIVEKESEQVSLFEKGEWWEEHWKGMPEFKQKNLEPFKTIYVHFETREDMNAFAKMLNQKISVDTRSIWYPEAEINDFSKKKYMSTYEPGQDEDDFEEVNEA